MFICLKCHNIKYLDVNLTFILSRIEKVEQHVRRKVHKSIVLRF